MSNGNDKVYEKITGQIIALLEKGVVPWAKPWTVADLPRSFSTGKPYGGLNALYLGAVADDNGYGSPFWITYRQAKKAGGHVRKGERGHSVYFWKITKKLDENGEPVMDANGREKKFFFARMYTVFNLDQTEGVEIPKGKRHEIPEAPKGAAILDEAERVVDQMPKRPVISDGGDRASYAPALDVVQMPYRETFRSTEDYYSVLFHELGHSTGHKSRLDRKEIEDFAAFGDETYSKEELTAEMCAAFLCGHVGIVERTIDNSAAYIKGWTKKLKDDPKIVMNASTKAARAAEYVLGNVR